VGQKERQSGSQKERWSRRRVSTRAIIEVKTQDTITSRKQRLWLMMVEKQRG
jgi:hypothetical protein